MNIVIHPVHFDASSQLIDFINKKVKKLETFFDKIIEAEVFLKIGTKQNIKDKIVELKITVPGKTLFVTEVSKTFEESTDVAVSTISRQLKKHKSKLIERNS
ncbi:MAG: ribosome-associated translation inhibitor RaiA [Chitinophagales bacterium]|nr:ribosome-associated translation inhibitor RaiA [Chitinophagales bacterium]MDW8272827.1 ribosome-associated translation inhibitor RaiA [Chitinophagales bacterium]